MSEILNSLSVLQDRWAGTSPIPKIGLLDFAQKYVPKSISLPIAPFHREICTLAESSNNTLRHAEADPRGHGKSTWWSKIFPFWTICTRRKRFVVLLSSSLRIAESNLSWIKHELEHNRTLRKDFGDLAGTEKWTSSELLTTIGAKIMAMGAGANLRGITSGDNRPDLIVCDDLEDRENISTFDQREKIAEWFNKDLMGLPGPMGADVFIIGTILHHDSLLAKKITQWKGTLRRAVSDWDKEEVLAPGLFPVEKLKLIRDGDGHKKGIGTLAFGQEYQNNPVDPASQRIRQEWIKYYDLKELKDKELIIASALDPAVGKTSQGDFAALVTLGQDTKTNMIYVLDVILERCPPQRQVDLCLQTFMRWKSNGSIEAGPARHFKALGIEDNGFQAVLRSNLEAESKRLGIFAPIKGIKNISDKIARIDSLSPLIEGGGIMFQRPPREFRTGQKDYARLIQQLIEFPKGDHDDGPDALEMAVRLLRVEPWRAF